MWSFKRSFGIYDSEKVFKKHLKLSLFLEAFPDFNQYCYEKLIICCNFQCLYFSQGNNCCAMLDDLCAKSISVDK